MLRRYTAFALLLTATSSYAVTWQQNLPVRAAVNSNSPIEYEIAKDVGFASKALVDQGYSQSTTLKGNLPPGLYFFRHRIAPTDAGPGEWSAPVQIMIAGEVTTKFFEPLSGAIVESPTPATALLYRWKRVEGATQYTLDLHSADGKKTFQHVSKNPFYTATLSYGSWSARVSVYFGGKKVSSSSPVNVIIEPSTQEGVEFLQPQSDDVIEANKKSYLKIKRLYTPLSSTLTIRSMRGKNSELKLNRDLSPTNSSVTIPALAAGTYQISITDHLNAYSVVESNMLIRTEVDPLLVKTQGSETLAEGSFGLLMGTAFQSNHYLGSYKPEEESGGPRFQALVRNEYYDPYNIEFRGEALKTRFKIGDRFPYDTNSNYELMLSMSLLYPLAWPTGANRLFARAGLFSKQFHQVSENFSVPTFGFKMAQETPVRLWGIITGADWNWQTWSAKWTARFSTRLMFPFFSTSMRIATASVTPLPSAEVSATLARELNDFIHLTLSPELKYEYWKVSEVDADLRSSSHYQLRYGLQLGLGMEL